MQKLSKAESGRLGAEKSRIIAAQLKQERANLYNLNPKTCTHCDSPLGYDDRHKKFCNSSCSATYNNLKKTQDRSWQCLHCGKSHLVAEKRLGKYCDTVCQHAHQYESTVTSWLNGETSAGKNVIKKYLSETHGYACAECGLSEWRGKKIVLELEHRDGNSENNSPENLCLICPNCHSQTDTYKGKNKGQGRHSRKLRYQEGRSY